MMPLDYLITVYQHQKVVELKHCISKTFLPLNTRQNKTRQKYQHDEMNKNNPDNRNSKNNQSSGPSIN